VPARDYAAATGVRARSDLSANPTPPAPRITRAELAKVVDYLGPQVAKARQHGRPTFPLKTELADRLLDVCLEIVNAELIP
jgi:hypothetical protein